MRARAAQKAETVYLPAPVGGVNTIDPVSAMPKTDCIYSHNLINSEYGLRSRLGYQEWVKNLTGSVDAGVRSVVPYNGSAKNGAADRLFAVTETGIWDCSSSTAAPSKVLAFASSAGDAGWGSSHAFTTPGGHFLLYCDEVNGLFLYTESTGLWAAVPGGVMALWATSTAISVGTQVQNLGNQYICTVAGLTAALGAGPTGVGMGIADNTVAWNYVGPAATNSIGPSIYDQNNGLTGLPINFAFVASWGSRLWFVERDTSRAWFLNVNSIFGVATAQDFGIKMPHGGPLVGLYGWSYDGGSGMKTELVAISTAGDVVIYEGTDPTSATTFALRGAWYCGGVPAGRRVAIEFGGEVLVISLLGLLPLSKLVTGASIFDRSQYATQKVTNLFNLQVQFYRTLPGWSIFVHPQDNALVVNVPQPPDYQSLQFAMSFASKGWGDYRGLPILSAAVWNGSLYFGTADGRVCINQGYVDNVPLNYPGQWFAGMTAVSAPATQMLNAGNFYTCITSGTAALTGTGPSGNGVDIVDGTIHWQYVSASTPAFVPVAWSLLHAFQNGGSMRQKLATMIRPDILAGIDQPGIQVVAKFDYDTDEPADTSSPGGGASSSEWDVGKWDVSTWASDYTPDVRVYGATGMGRAVSVAIRGQAISKTIYVGCDVAYEQGGIL